MKPLQNIRWRTELGEALGYPSCCIKSFIEGNLPPTPSPFKGTGFRPCLSCITNKSAQEIIAEINDARLPSLRKYLSNDLKPHWLIVEVIEGKVIPRTTYAHAEFVRWREKMNQKKKETKLQT